MTCNKCILHKYRTLIVKGRGAIPASLLIIGEAPGISEDAIGKAFVGQSGHLLNRMLGTFKDFYITNCILCRPCNGKDQPNRQPTKEEILKCTPNILKIIKQVKPKVVILAGKVAEDTYKNEFPDAYIMQHPAFLLRTGGLFSPYYRQNALILEEAINAISNY